MKAIITHTTPTHEDKVTILKGTHLLLREEEYGTICVIDNVNGKSILLGAFKNCSSVMLKGKPKAAPSAVEGAKSVSMQELTVKLEASDLIAKLSESITACETIDAEYGGLNSRLHELEELVQKINTRLDGHEAFNKSFAQRFDEHQLCIEAQDSNLQVLLSRTGSLDSTIQGFFTRFAELERRLGALDCPKPPVANPAPAPFTYKDGICYLNEAAIEKGFVIDSSKWKLTMAETPDGRTIVKGMGLDVIRRAQEAHARTEADNALAQRIDTADALGTHPGDVEYPAPPPVPAPAVEVPPLEPLSEADVAALEDTLAVEEAIEDDSAAREGKRKAKQDMHKR